MTGLTAASCGTVIREASGGQSMGRGCTAPSSHLLRTSTALYPRPLAVSGVTPLAVVRCTGLPPAACCYLMLWPLRASRGARASLRLQESRAVESCPTYTGLGLDPCWSLRSRTFTAAWPLRALYRGSTRRTHTGLRDSLFACPALMAPQGCCAWLPRRVRPCQLAARVARSFLRRCPRMP